MKKWIFVCAAVWIMTACNQSKFTIEGKVSGAEGEVLYLESLSVGKSEVINSVELDANGDFKFRHDAPRYPEFYRLRLGESVVHLAIDSTETLHFSTTGNRFAEEYQLTGSDECEKMRIVSQESARLKTRLNELSQAMSSEQSNVEELREQAIQDLANYKEKMLGLVLENPSAATAYYIVFQEINGERIFDPYDSSDRRLIAAVATSYDLHYPGSARTQQLKEMTLQAIAAERAASKTPTELEAHESTLLDIDLYDHLGRKQTLSQVAKTGKVILLDFTVYQAEYAPVYNMKLAELYKKYATKGFEIYQVSLDVDEQAWRVSADNLPWICVRDPQTIYSGYAAMYNVKNLPTCFIIDRDGGIVKRVEKANEIEAAIQAQL